MAILLNIETATTNCSVALSQNGKTLCCKEVNDINYSHAESLHVFIDEVLKATNLSLIDIDGIAISKGPGSYTGLRIGVSAAKGLCFAVNKPLIAVPSLQALAYQIEIQDGHIVPLLDARRMEVYTAIYNSKYALMQDTSALILDKNSYLEYLSKGPVYFIGNGVEKLKTIIQHPNAIYIDHILASAKTMGVISEAKFNNNDFEDVAYFEPFYLKDFFVTTPKTS